MSPVHGNVLLRYMPRTNDRALQNTQDVTHLLDALIHFTCNSPSIQSWMTTSLWSYVLCLKQPSPGEAKQSCTWGWRWNKGYFVAIQLWSWNCAKEIMCKGTLAMQSQQLYSKGWLLKTGSTVFDLIWFVSNQFNLPGSISIVQLE